MNEPNDFTSITPGLSAEVVMTVTESETAAHLGSGSIAVYATPAMVALMENAAIRALKGHLPNGTTTVGGRIDVRHLAATPVGTLVRAQAELVEAQGRKLRFHIRAWDEVEQIGEASHVRLIVDEDKFMESVNKKGK